MMPPMRGRELKHFYFLKVYPRISMPPMRGRELKLESINTFSASPHDAPYAGA